MQFRIIFIFILAISSLATLCSCQKKEPVLIGFLGGITGRVADLGVAGRNGVQLAVEQRNAAGGINGRLIDRKIELIIGPMTSSMAMAVMPQINASKTILLSPTVTTNDLTGKDDNFLRVISSTTEYAAKSARYQYEKLGVRTVVVIYDIANKSYCESWLNDFQTAFSALGGHIVLVKSFSSGKDTVFLPLVRELLSARADAVVIISNTVDSALICQQVRKLDPDQRIAMSEWASTERFIELAGDSAEGVVVSQFLDRNNTSQSYRDFLAAYQKRYKQNPGFAGVAGYDAALAAMEAYAVRSKGNSIKSVIIGRKTFQGLQQPLTIDRYGDADRKTFVTAIHGNKFITVE
jgi:branched-chain amino acid transport system substrate-binding protein